MDCERRINLIYLMLNNTHTLHAMLSKALFAAGLRYFYSRKIAGNFQDRTLKLDCICAEIIDNLDFLPYLFLAVFY